MFAYQRIELDNDTILANKIFNKIIVNKKVSYTWQEAWQAFKNFIPNLKARDLLGIMEVLENRNIVRSVPVEPVFRPGRPAKCSYQVNPMIFE